MLKYRDYFLSKIKSFLPYFEKFFNNKFILSKVYSNDYQKK